MVLRSIKSMQGYQVKTLSEHNLGTIQDFYFDDHGWNVCYLVVDTGAFLSARKILISPEACQQLDWTEGILMVDLSLEEVKDSPDIDLTQPITCGQESDLRDHYGWQPINRSGSGLLIGHSILTPPEVLEESVRVATLEEKHPRDNKPHLRSSNQVLDYSIQARDGGAGHVEDFLVDDQSWTIQYILVDTRNWLPGKKVLISPTWIEKLDEEGSQVQVNLSQETVKNSPEYNPAVSPDQEFEEKVYDHQDQTRNWLQR